MLSASRRRQLLRWAHAHDSYVIEDDYDGELRYDIRPIQAIKGEHGGGILPLAFERRNIQFALKLNF